jgi:hypothetical protein
MSTVHDRLAQRAKANRIRLRDHLHPSYHDRAAHLFATRPLHIMRRMAEGAAREMGHGEPIYTKEGRDHVELIYPRLRLLVTPTAVNMTRHDFRPLKRK